MTSRVLPIAREAAPVTPSGPRAWPIVGSLLSYYRDPLGFVTDVARRHGDVALVRVTGLPFYLLSDPADIDAVLVTRHRDFGKGSLGAERRLLFGNGLATSDGDFWRRQRRLMQPAFHRERIAAYGRAIVARTETTLAGWREGEERELHADMMRLALENVAKTLFDADVGGDANAIGEALGDLMTFFTRQESLFLRLIPRKMPTPGRARFRRAVARLDAIVADLVEQRRRRPAADLLSMLVEAQDEDGGAMSNRQLRDEVMTLLLAGHETTALALSWTLSLLARHPKVDARVAAEVAALGGRAPTVADLPGLRFVEAVIKEAMRLYPPAWILARQAKKDVPIGPWVIPERAFVVMSQWVVHRDPRWYPQADRFLPERWLGDLERELPRHAYFPFGGGPRVCIGAAFAQMEATLVLATLVRRFRVELLRDVVPEASISLRPKGGVRVRLHRRGEGERAS